MTLLSCMVILLSGTYVRYWFVRCLCTRIIKVYGLAVVALLFVVMTTNIVFTSLQQGNGSCVCNIGVSFGLETVQFCGEHEFPVFKCLKCKYNYCYILLPIMFELFLLKIARYSFECN